jgi:hypothetical protein
LIFLFLCIAWRERSAFIAIYLATWACFLAYSVPPLRLKARGFAGILMDAIGSSMLPCILAVLLASDLKAEKEIALWMGAVALWSLMFGMRGIVWHQIADWKNDHAAKTPTFVVKEGPQRASQLTRYVTAPLEFIALAAMCALLDSKEVYVALIASGVFVILKVVRFSSFPALVDWQDRTYFLLHDFYLVFFPFAILINLISLGLAPGWIIAAHLVIFLPTHLNFLREFTRIIHH